MSEQIYRILARKYRPQNFSDLIGQEAMVRTLRNAFKSQRLAQAWMLTGVRGVGKTTTARILARALNYASPKIDHPSLDLTEFGEHCLDIIEGRHIDVLELDAASHTGIDDIRHIIEQMNYKPLRARYKIYIIDEVHMLSNQAFNGLLKTLEEPPLHAKFIFATTDSHKVPVTILSRCQRFDLRRIDTPTLAKHLQKIAALEKIEINGPALNLLARAGAGSVRDSLSLLDQAIAYGDGTITREDVEKMLGLSSNNDIIELFNHLSQGETEKALKLAQEQYNNGADPIHILQNLADINHHILKRKIIADITDNSLSLEQNEIITKLAQSLSVRALSRYWQMLLKAINEVSQAFLPYEAMEMAIIRLCHAAHLPQLDDIINYLGAASLKDTPLSEGACDIKPSPPSNQEQPAKEPQDEAKLDVQEQAISQANLREANLTEEGFNELARLIALADKHDPWLRSVISSNLHIYECSDHSLRFYNNNSIPANAERLQKALKNLTGKEWQLIEEYPSPQSQLPKTYSDIIKEKQAKADSAYRQAVAQEPLVDKALKEFPSAKIMTPQEKALKAQS